jgi:poly(A) polymerase Pap1
MKIMTQDNHNQTTLSENKIIEQLDEQALQAVNGGCQGCDSIHSLADAAITKSNRLADKANNSYHAGRARVLADDFNYLKGVAGEDSSSSYDSCCNYQNHSERYQSLKRRYKNLKSDINNS